MQSYDGLLDIAKFPALKNLSPRTITSMIINNFQNINLSLGIGVYAAVPETGCDVGKTVIGFGGSVVGDFVKTLVGSRGIQRTEMLDIRPDFDIVEGHVKSLLYITATGIKSRREADLTHMVSQGDKSLRIIPLSEEQEAIHTVIVGDKLVNNLIGKFLTDIFLQKRGVAPNAITLAVADVNRQGNPVRYLLNDH